MSYLLFDYLLVEEVVPNDKLGDTGITLKYDDTERFMYVKIIQASPELYLEINKMYPALSTAACNEFVNGYFEPGKVLLINRVAKTPYKEGTYFISIKDVIGVI